MSEAILTALIESIPETVAIIVVALLGWRQIHRVRVEINGKLEQMLADRYSAGQRQGRDEERGRQQEG